MTSAHDELGNPVPDPEPVPPDPSPPPVPPTPTPPHPFPPEPGPEPAPPEPGPQPAAGSGTSAAPDSRADSPVSAADARPGPLPVG